MAGQYRWRAPVSGAIAPGVPVPDFRVFSSLRELQEATGQEQRGIEIDFDIFERMVPPDPTRRHAVYHARDLDFRLKAGSAAIDSGAVIPTVNEGFVGAAPDLGALELGGAEPQYGPRWLSSHPFYQ